ncbi:MAG: elongation factor P maturation arginine rhamnosyltransferase EarP [Pseudomonadota bacterium]
MAFNRNIDLFCRVVDNFGDIGVCWRLSRQLVNDYALKVTLWVDDLTSFHKICAGIDPLLEWQQMQGVTIRHWREISPPKQPESVADVVIEAFGCQLPASYIAAMAACEPRPVWINLEYLSAEPWVEGCHEMQSLYPSLPLVKYFFFPGFSDKTGGLLMERDVSVRRTAFQNDPQAVAGFLENIGVRPLAGACMVSLFCYPSAPVETFFDAWQADTLPVLCLVPQGVATDAVSAFLRMPATVGAAATRGGLTVQVVPFLDQPDYDKLLWSCELNFVRGEDSLVRAQWAGRPFIWQIYPQQEDAHRIKLDALLDRHTAGMPNDLAPLVSATWQAWNGSALQAPQWPRLRSLLPQWTSHMAGWTRELQRNGDLASNLVQFIKKIG